MSKIILKDLLGVDGDHALKDLKKAREKKLKRNKRRIDEIYFAVTHFEDKCRKRRTNLKALAEQSKAGTYSRHRPKWEEEYRSIMNERSNS